MVAASPEEDEAGFPFTRIGHYDNGNWSFTDLAFAVAGIAHSRHEGSFDPIIYVLGERGEIIRLDRPEDISIVSDPDAPSDAKLGLFTSLTAIGSKLFICGDGGQFYTGRLGEAWKAIPHLLDRKGESVEDDILALLQSPHLLNDAAYMKQHLERLDAGISRTLWRCAGNHENDVYICGGRGNVARVLLHWDGMNLTDMLEAQQDGRDYTSTLVDVLVEGQNVWAAGHHGALLTGSRTRGFSHDAAAVTDELYYHLALFDGKLYLASNVALYRHDGERLARIRPGFPLRGSSFHTIQSAGETLWALGPNDIANFNGTSWSRIEWPLQGGF